MPHDVFISYRDTANDKAAADRVCRHLEAEGFSCWIAPRDVPVGDDFGAAIVNAIRACRVLVLIFSAEANASPQLVRELKLADDAKKTVLPIRIENVRPSGSLAYFLGAAHWLDAFGGVQEEHLRRLVLGLRKRLSPAGEVPGGSETEHNEQIRLAVEAKRRPGIRWTGTTARYTYAAVALVAVVVIAWKLREVVLHTPAGGKPPETSGPQAAGAAAKPGTDSKIRTRVNSVDGLTYVFIPAGSFMMGCSPGDNECFDEEKTPHAEQIANGFWLGRTEVTQAAWKKVTGGDNPSHFKGLQLPVEQVDWTQAVDYCKIIGGRLPTEKEWEYAARAGTTGSRYGPLDAVAWYNGNSGGTTHPVALKLANDFGLYDMLGNVREWTADDDDAGHKVVRGGSWGYTRPVRASYRIRYEPSRRDNGIGFRCVAEFR